MELTVLIILLVAVIALLILFVTKRNDKPHTDELQETLRRQLQNDQTALQQQLQANREELTRSVRESVGDFRKEITQTLGEGMKQVKETLGESMKQLQETLRENMRLTDQFQRQKFETMSKQQDALVQSTEKRLDEMRKVVEEKLQATLNERIGQSFKMVSTQLENVQRGLGEMQSLAQDVGGLKRVLSNVKTRGTFGEVQLGALLEQIMSPEQYATNVQTRPGSREVVEFALRLPGKDDTLSAVYLPIDSKFPQDTYEHYCDAFDTGDAEAIEAAGKQLETAIQKMARDIHDKYLEPPYTTDFAIMFLPFESIYAEVIRRTSLMETLQRKYKVVVTGPTTLGAILNSLQMGFRTLAIEKRSSEVWTVLSAVKTEFGKFGDLLEKVQNNLHTASNQLDDVIGTRTRAIKRSLRNVEELPAEESRRILPFERMDEE